LSLSHKTKKKYQPPIPILSAINKHHNQHSHQYHQPTQIHSMNHHPHMLIHSTQQRQQYRPKHHTKTHLMGRSDFRKFPMLMKIRTLITILALPLIAIIAPSAHAQNIYPIKELGNCSNTASCYTYCQIPQNTPACWSYGKYILHKDVLGDQATSVTFPIAELGNCTSAQACKDYCSQDANHDACTSYATKIGLIKPHMSVQNILQQAKEQLGCTNQASCKAFCSEQANQDKCLQFARAVGLARAANVSSSSKPQELLDKAKQKLGCDSQEACKQFCSQAENQEKCKEFAQKNLRNGIERRRMHPGTTQDMSNPSSIYGRQASTGATWQMKSPCNEGQCKDWCQQNPGKCPGFSKQGSGSAMWKNEFDPTRKRPQEKQQNQDGAPNQSIPEQQQSPTQGAQNDQPPQM
jgi:hypothetical protein